MQVQSNLYQQIESLQQKRKLAIRYRDVLLAMRYHHQEKILQKKLNHTVVPKGGDINVQRNLFQ